MSFQSNVTRPSAAPTLDTKEAEERYAKLKDKAGRFRILIIGGANAGKTTILKKVCNTIDEPDIYDASGKMVNKSKLEPTILRGEHDIENEMIFRSNPTLIFHDSRGFEAGGVDEFRKAKEFVAKCAKGKRLQEQIHAIWYCIALDDDRPITYAEKQFFHESGTGKVPVIAVFTKCEALEIKAIELLQDKGYDFDDATEKAPKYVEEHLRTVHKPLEEMKYPPKGLVYLQELDKPEKNCQDLIECTMKALDDNILQGLLIATQQNALELAMGKSLSKALETAWSFDGPVITTDLAISMFDETLKYFPHYYWNNNNVHAVFVCT